MSKTWFEVNIESITVFTRPSTTLVPKIEIQIRDKMDPDPFPRKYPTSKFEYSEKAAKF